MSDTSPHIIEKHTLGSRWLHWINFPLLSLMVWSGTLIYWAHQPYVEIPKEMAKNFSIQYRLAEGMGWHFFLMWPFAINGFCYLLYLSFSGRWRELAPLKNKSKYNMAQRIAYSIVILMGVGSILTGLAIYKPVQLGILTSLLGGYEAARFEHFVLTVGFIVFFLIHIIQVARSGWNNFRSMIAGYEIEK